MNEEFKTTCRLLSQLNNLLSDETTTTKAREVIYHQKLLVHFLLPNYKLLNQWLEEHGVAVVVAAGDKFNNQNSSILVAILQIKIELEKTIVWITSVNHLLTRSLLAFLETGSTDSNIPSKANFPSLLNVDLLQRTLVLVNSFEARSSSAEQFDVVNFKQIFLYDSSLLRDIHTSLAQLASLVQLLQVGDEFLHVSTLLITDYQLNLCLVRNLIMERDNTKLTQAINQLFSSNAINDSLISFINCSIHLGSNYQNQLVVFYSLLFQIFSLIFSNLNKILSVETDGEPEIMLEVVDWEYKTKLTSLASSLCTSGAFANLVKAMLRLLTSRRSILIGVEFFDICYFLWFLKFMVRYFVLNSNEALVAANTQDQQDFRIYRNGSENPEKSFLNETSNKSAIETKRVLLSYDLFGFIVFKMLESFESLLFDSNSKNVEFMFQYRLREYYGSKSSLRETVGSSKQHQATNPHLSATSSNYLPKIANTHFLKVLYLSISCLHELLECISYHLSSIDDLSRRRRLNSVSNEHFLFLSEFLNFEDLKLSFAFLMRFYCYNPHIYSDSLLKLILLTNKLYLNTFQSTYNLIRQLHNQEERDQLEMSTNATKNSSTISSLNFKPTSLNRLYDLYANTDTSFIFRHILVKFVDNDTQLNKACIDFLDNLLKKSKKSYRLFHMDLTVALANISMMENFRSLDQQTKEVVSNMLYEIRRLCKRKPYKANRIIFDIRAGGNNNNNNKSGGSAYKRIKLDQNLSSGTSAIGQVNESETTFSSSWSSLLSTSSYTASSKSDHKTTKNSSTNRNLTGALLNKPLNMNNESKACIENEFLFCIRSIDIYSRRTGAVESIDYNIKFEHLFKVFSYLADMYSLNNGAGRPTSWQVYECLRSLSVPSEVTNNSNSLGQSISLQTLSSYKNEFLSSRDCVNLRRACQTSQFKKNLKQVYIKFLMNKLYSKSRRTKSAVFWLFSLMRNLKAYSVRSDRMAQLNQASTINFLLLSSTRPSSEFRNKLFANYHSNKLGVPCIPFTLDLQQVFHSVDFSHLMELLGLSHKKKFPHVPYSWLESTQNGETKLDECLRIFESYLCK